MGASVESRKVGIEKTLEEVERLGVMASATGAKGDKSSVQPEMEPLKVYGGQAESGKVVKKRMTQREKMLRQVADLDEGVFESVLGHVRDLSEKFHVLKSGSRGTAIKFKTRLSRFMKDLETTLAEHVGNTAGGVNAVVNLKAFEAAMADDLTPSELEKARADRSAHLYGVMGDSLKDFRETQKARMAPLKPAVPSWQAASGAGATLTPNAAPTSEGFLEYEQPLTPWEYDPALPTDLDTALIVTPLRKAAPHKFVLVAVDSQATEEDIKKAVLEACDQHEIQITGVEIFTDLVANKQRKHAFVSVQNLAQLQHVLNDRVRAFGVHINGQRSSILDVEEKNIVSIMTRPPMDASRIDTLLKDLGIMNLVTKDSTAPKEPLITSHHLNPVRTNRFSIFAPRDGNGDLIGKAWINFPTHASAYAAYHSLIACRPGAIRAFWSQKAPNHFEEAIRLRDALAAENVELKQKVLSLSSSPDADSDEPTPEDELSLDHVVSTHIKKVLATVRGDLNQAAQLLNITEKTLSTHLRKYRSSGLDIPLAETRGKSRLTSSRE